MRLGRNSRENAQWCHMFVDICPSQRWTNCKAFYSYSLFILFFILMWAYYKCRCLFFMKELFRRIKGRKEEKTSGLIL